MFLVLDRGRQRELAVADEDRTGDSALDRRQEIDFAGVQRKRRGVALEDEVVDRGVLAREVLRRLGLLAELAIDGVFVRLQSAGLHLDRAALDERDFELEVERGGRASLNPLELTTTT